MARGWASPFNTSVERAGERHKRTRLHGATMLHGNEFQLQRLGNLACISGFGDVFGTRGSKFPWFTSSLCETPTPQSVHPRTSDVVVRQHRPSRSSKARLSRQHRPTSRPAGPGAPRPAGPKPARSHQGCSRPAGPDRRRWPGDGDVTTSPSNARKGDVVSRRHRLSRGVLMGSPKH